MPVHIARQENPRDHGDLEQLIRACLKRGLLDKAEQFMVLKEQHQANMRRQSRGVPERKALIRQMRAAEAKAARLSEYMAKLGYPQAEAQAKLAEIGLDTRSDEEQCAEVLAESDARLVDVDKLFD